MPVLERWQDAFILEKFANLGSYPLTSCQMCIRWSAAWGLVRGSDEPGAHLRTKGVVDVLSDLRWSILFSVAIAVLMLAILLIRTEPVDPWVLFVYPTVGALLAHVASRTSPTIEEIAWIETSTIAAACIVVLAALVNLLLIEVLMREVVSGEFLNGTLFRQFSFFALPTIAALLWWALERRLSRMRKLGRASLQATSEGDKSGNDPGVSEGSETAREEAA